MAEINIDDDNLNSSSPQEPAQPNTYQGKQIVLDSDRILFNAKKDSILLYSDKSVGINSVGSIHINTGNNEFKNYIVLNSPTIFLGMKENGTEPPNEPAVKGIALTKYLLDIVELIEDMKVFLTGTYNVTSQKPGDLSQPGVNSTRSLDESILDLRDTINNIKSKTVYIS